MIKYVVVIVAYLISFVTQAQAPKQMADCICDEIMTVTESVTIRSCEIHRISNKGITFELKD